MAMVSHHPPGTDTKMAESLRAGKERERREGDDIYHSHPIPSMPPLFTRPRPPPDSMLDYTQRMRQIAKARGDPSVGDAAADSSPQTVLEIQARHIPKGGHGQKRHGDGKPRRPMSLDELIGRRGKNDESSISTDAKRKDRCKSEPVVIPSLSSSSSRSRSEREKEKRIRINFVSTADLFDLVDFSLRSKRSDDVHLARVEDTLKLIKEANFFRSISSRRKMKPGPLEKEVDVDRASLLVQGTSSPQESSRNKLHEVHDKGDGLARKGSPTHSSDAYDSDDEDEDDDDDERSVDWDFDLIQDKRHMLLQPPKLHYRPKRAKRMRLHRSLLSAIPEDEHGQRTQHHRPSVIPDYYPRIPVIPTSSSLTAIKGSRLSETLPFPEPGSKTTTNTGRKHGRRHKASGDELLSPHLNSPHAESSTSKHGQNYDSCPEINRSQHRFADAESDEVDHPHGVKTNPSHSSKKKDSPRKASSDIRSSSLRGRSELLEAHDPRHKKIRKIIFLRDLPAHPKHT